VFPFERHRSRIGRPLGIKLADFQGLVAAPDLKLSTADLLEGCGLSVWHFDHLLLQPAVWAPWHGELADSPYLDLSAGYAAYAAERKLAGTNQIAQTDRKRRKLEREVGPIRFEWHTDRHDVFETLLQWKSAQRRQTGTFDVLHFPWVVELLDRLRLTGEGKFQGVLSALYANERLIAAHLGMRSNDVLHHWFPAYDHGFYRYSPGLILMLELASASAEWGVRRIDLGKGNDQYKDSFRSAGLTVATGAADARPARHSLRRAWFSARRWIKSSPYQHHIRYPKRLIRRLQNQCNMG
jgi:CelD/BcsL family acetyltransferase involved in cellulose biosynthesis